MHIPGHGEKQFKDHDAGLGIQSAGRFVAEEDLWVFGQSSCDGNSLLFAAGELVGEIVDVIRKTDRSKHVMTAQGIGGDIFYKRYILDHGQCRDQIVGLKNKTDSSCPVICQFVGCEGRDILPVNPDGSGSRTVKSPQKV